MVHAVEDLKDLKDQLSQAGQKLVVIDFYASWSAHFHTMVMQGMSNTLRSLGVDLAR
jgi:hypothetical protein